MATTIDNSISTGNLIQIGTMVAISATFIFRKYFGSEEKGKEVDKHSDLIGKLTATQVELTTTQVKQQVLIDGHGDRIKVLEERQWAAGRDFGENFPRRQEDRTR